MKNIFGAALCLAVLLPCRVMAGDDGLPVALRSLVETERSFAKRCGEVGIRASFLEFFADDAIAFTPQPVRYKEAVKNLPAPDPHAVRLEWEPRTGDISASSDLGFTTGPSVRTNAKEPDQPRRYGQFLSVWKKQSDGSWKVAADIGVSAPEEISPLGTPFTGFHEVAATTGVSSDKNRDPLERDRELSGLCASKGLLEGYCSRASEEVRLLREDHKAIVGATEARLFLAKEVSTASWSPTAGEISRAGDLCYAYGSYELKLNPGGNVETGYYLHIWKRDGHGDWKLVSDAENPVAPEQKK